jgi:hypothetical protein
MAVATDSKKCFFAGTMFYLVPYQKKYDIKNR